MDVSILGVDLGENSCSVGGLDATGEVVVRRRMRRETVISYADGLPSCVAAMEACCGAHHMGRALVRQGHTVRLISPEYVRQTGGRSVPVATGDEAARDITEAFRLHYSHEHNVTCTFVDGKLQLVTENDYNPDCLILIDECSDNFCASTEPFGSNMKLVSVETIS